MKYQIKHRYTDAVFFECDLPDSTPSGLITRRTLEKAVNAGANLDGANLTGANLTGANLDGKKLIGNRPIFMIGPIGSRCFYFTSYITDAGIMLRAGCFFGSIDEFKSKLIEEHGENDHRKEYEAALTLIECHNQIWK